MWEFIITLIIGLFLGALIGGVFVSIFLDDEDLPPDDLFKR